MKWNECIYCGHKINPLIFPKREGQSAKCPKCGATVTHTGYSLQWQRADAEMGTTVPNPPMVSARRADKVPGTTKTQGDRTN